MSSSQPLLQTGCIQLMDSENTHATWRATGLADQPISAAPGSVGQRSIENLHQLRVTRGKHREFIFQQQNWRKPGLEPWRLYVYPIVNRR